MRLPPARDKRHGSRRPRSLRRFSLRGMVPYLNPQTPFPPVATARDDHGGLLAVGGGLQPERLLAAYRAGIFPWGTVEGHPVWYSPNPRMVLFPEHFRLTRSLRKTLRSGRYEVRFDSNFSGVIDGCAQTPRPGQDGTWITEEMRTAYVKLHELGWAHSVETYAEGILVGGLYGLAIGRMFYGESMFSCRNDASKVAFAYLVRQLQHHRIAMIDCQMHTAHLDSLGGCEIPRTAFLERLAQLTAEGALRTIWTTDNLDLAW